MVYYNRFLSLLFVLIFVPVVQTQAGPLLQDSLPWGGRIVFGNWVRVDDAPGNSNHIADHPITMIDDSLNIYVVWQDNRDNDLFYDIYFAVSRDTGTTFTTPNIPLSNSPDTNDVYPWLDVDSNGNIYAVWQSKANNMWKIYFTKSTDGGVSFTSADTLTGVQVVNDFDSGINFGPQPKIVVDSWSDTTTYIYVIWADNRTGSIQIRLALSTDGGSSFQDLGIVDNNPGSVNRHPYISLDDSGWVYVAWAGGTGGSNQDPHPYIYFNKSTDHGQTFLGVDVKVNDEDSQYYRGNPTVIVNRNNGNILACWEDSRRAGGNGNPDLWFSRSTDAGSTFSSNLRVNWWEPDTTLRYDNFRPDISIDPTGIMVVGWHSNPIASNSFGIYMTAYSDSLGAFISSQSLVNTFTGTSGANFGNTFYPPSLKVALVDTVTNFFFVWQDLSEDPSGNIYFVRGWVVKTLAAPNLDSLKVYPNPYKPHAGHQRINFSGLTAEATVRIYDISGNLMEEILENDGDGLATWDGDVSSGIYVYYIFNPQEEKKLGKLSVIR
jgi:hypothetical protein